MSALAIASLLTTTCKYLSQEHAVTCGSGTCVCHALHSVSIQGSTCTRAFISIPRHALAATPQDALPYTALQQGISRAQIAAEHSAAPACAAGGMDMKAGH